MKLEIKMDDLLKDMKEYTDRMEYLIFFHELVTKTSPTLAKMIDEEFVQEFGKLVPVQP